MRLIKPISERGVGPGTVQYSIAKNIDDSTGVSEAIELGYSVEITATYENWVEIRIYCTCEKRSR